MWLQQTRIGLSLYDVTGLGYLRESDLESYILELIPTLPQVCPLLICIVSLQVLYENIYTKIC